MPYPTTENIPYQEIENGALMLLLLLRVTKTWDGLCERFAHANPDDLLGNTTTMALRDKLVAMRDLGLIEFEDEETEEGTRPGSDIKVTDLWQKIRVAFGGVSLLEAAMISRHSQGMAVAPVFGRPREQGKPLDVFVLMPFDAGLENVYTKHIKKLGDKLGLVIQRADEIPLPGRPFMEKVWGGICGAQLILADCTEQNANVFYEIGMAHAVGKKVVFITRSDDDIPSDIKHFDYIHYLYDPEGTEQLVEKLETLMRAHFDL